MLYFRERAVHSVTVHSHCNLSIFNVIFHIGFGGRISVLVFISWTLLTFNFAVYCLGVSVYGIGLELSCVGVNYFFVSRFVRFFYFTYTYSSRSFTEVW